MVFSAYTFKIWIAGMPMEDLICVMYKPVKIQSWQTLGITEMDNLNHCHSSMLSENKNWGVTGAAKRITANPKANVTLIHHRRAAVNKQKIYTKTCLSHFLIWHWSSVSPKWQMWSLTLSRWFWARETTELSGDLTLYVNWMVLDQLHQHHLSAS